MWQSPSMRSLAYEGVFPNERVKYLVKRVYFQAGIPYLGLGVGAGNSVEGSAPLSWQRQKQREHWQFLEKEEKTKPEIFLPV